MHLFVSYVKYINIIRKTSSLYRFESDSQEVRVSINDSCDYTSPPPVSAPTECCFLHGFQASVG